MSSRKSSLKGSFGRSSPSYFENRRNTQVVDGRGEGGWTIQDNEDMTEKGIELCPQRWLNPRLMAIVPSTNTDSNV
ncbi:hypothetical protein GYH30_049999 [Glycine max]|nr:hypothetical protein GYH30_049999 [Glycine max]